MAEVMAFDDYKELGSETAVKVGPQRSVECGSSFCAGERQVSPAGQGFCLIQHMRPLTSPQTYTVQDGDIIFFKFNAGAGLTKAKK